MTFHPLASSRFIEAIEPRRLLAAAVTPVPDSEFVTASGGKLVFTDQSGTPQTTVAMPASAPNISFSSPQFSPDRTKVVFSSKSGAGTTSQLYVINVDGSGLQQLTNDAGDQGDPAFSPDGSKIAFVSKRSGNYEIYAMNADGTNEVRLTNNSASDLEPDFSPDGSRILFDSNRTGADQIYTMDAATGDNVTRLTNDSNDDVEPRYDPTGTRIVFNSFDRAQGATDSQVLVMPATGGPTTLIATASYYAHYTPSFSPDGSEILVGDSSPSDTGSASLYDSAGGGFFKTIDFPSTIGTVHWTSTPAFAGRSGQVVTVVGTPGNDKIALSGEDADGNLSFTLNGKTETFNAALVNLVEVFCGAGNDTLDGSQAPEQIYAAGDAGDDLLIGGVSNDTLTGGSGRNTLFGGDGDDRLNGSGGRDFLYGDNGNDREYGNGGNDYMVGGAGVDRMWGGDGDDLLSGNSGNDKMFGENGNDQLIGGDGNDLCYGGLGIDTVNGQKGTDSCDGDDADQLISIEVHP